MGHRDSEFGAGLLLGAAVGLALGLLYAPRRGEETRALLREKAEIAREKAEKAKEKAVELAEKAKEAATRKMKQEEQY